MAGADAGPQDFVNPKHLKNLVAQFEGVSQFLKRKGWDAKDVWLGETASAYDGGAFGLSNRYASGFLWLNKLGLAAEHNYKVVIRQTLYHGCYALIGEDGFPNPDFWISATHKKLVSSKVLKLTRSGFPDTFNAYAHCTRKSEHYTGVTVFAVNMGNDSFTFQLSPPLSQSSIKSFTFSPLDGDIRSRSILLNGDILKLTDDDAVPILQPVFLAPSRSISLTGLGIAFWVFSDAQIDICDR